MSGVRADQGVIVLNTNHSVIKWKNAATKLNRVAPVRSHGLLSQDSRTIPSVVHSARITVNRRVFGVPGADEAQHTRHNGPHCKCAPIQICHCMQSSECKDCNPLPTEHVAGDGALLTQFWSIVEQASPKLCVVAQAKVHCAAAKRLTGSNQEASSIYRGFPRWYHITLLE